MVFKENEALLDVLSDAISEGLVVVNNQQIIVSANKSTHETFGYEKGSLIGKPLNKLIPRDYHSKHGNHFKKFMGQKEKRQMGAGGNLFGVRKDGSKIPVEVGLNPFEIYGQTYIMAVVTDITERKNYTENLERTVAERTAQLNKALKKERQLNELKTQFLSLVSHEFKTPLSGISTSTALLYKYTKTEHQEQRDKHLNTIGNKVKHLDHILNDFLSVERLDSGKVNYKFTRFTLSKLVNEVIYNANLLLKEGQRISYPLNMDHIILDQDEKIMDLILSNIVNNAVKYSPENTTIAVDIKTEGDVLIITVSDQGIGIPEKDQKFIFDRYFRAGNALTNQGTGIGLNIVKAHLENLGGRICFCSKENKGTTFTVELPIIKKRQEYGYNITD